MPLLTLFSAPKPFTNPHIAMIQRNAIKSWTLLPDVEVILLGEEDGLAEAAKELGVKHISQVVRNAKCTPLISYMFKLARENSSSDLLCIINADMILMPDFVKAAMESDSLLSKNGKQRTPADSIRNSCCSVNVGIMILRRRLISPRGGSLSCENLSENRISFTVRREAISSSSQKVLIKTSPILLSAAPVGIIG
ncbi:MAG: hypothetical protein IPL71_01165 [Anaerolineales bacterium]|uniref:hypothetical protein n=1 Tax=Candidatus Villigracilis proximus TaxID=3140683 RepID=UPI003137387C|nr:hypothetical protein [Anaerolineales bacterium]